MYTLSFINGIHRWCFRVLKYLHLICRLYKSTTWLIFISSSEMANRRAYFWAEINDVPKTIYLAHFNPRVTGKTSTNVRYEIKLQFCKNNK